MFQVHFVLAFIRLTGWPSIDSSTMHLTFKPLSFIYATICHVERSFAMKYVVFQLASVYFAYVADVFAKALLYPIHILSVVGTTISPSLFAFAMRLIHLPVSLILLIISILKHAITVGMILDPLSFICIAIDTTKLPIARSSICFPITLILGLIWPNLRASALSLIINNVTVIDSSVSKLDHLSATVSRRRMLVDLSQIIETVLVVEFVIVLLVNQGHYGLVLLLLLDVF